MSETAYQCTAEGGLESIYLEDASELLNKYTILVVGTVGESIPL
jgi:hypothetical protein